MKWFKRFFNTYYEEINKQNSKQLLVTILSGSIGILWPLGGLLIFIISFFTKDKFYGKLAITSGAVALLCNTLAILVQK